MASKILYTNFKDKIGTLVSTKGLILRSLRKNRLNKKRNRDRSSGKMCSRRALVVVDLDLF